MLVVACIVLGLLQAALHFYDAKRAARRAARGRAAAAARRHARMGRWRAGGAVVWTVAFALKLLDDSKVLCTSEARTWTWWQLTAVFHVLGGVQGFASTAVQNEVLQRECGCFGDQDDGGGEKEGIDEEEGDGRAEEEGSRD